MKRVAGLRSTARSAWLLVAFVLFDGSGAALGATPAAVTQTGTSQTSVAQPGVVLASGADATVFRMLEGAGGVPIAAMEWGNRAGPAVLFLHGFSFSKEFWEHQRSSDLASRFHMVAIDLRGHGASGKPWTAALYQDTRLWADDIAAAIKAFGLVRPVLVGWSFGGFVAMDYLRHYGTDAVAGLMLVSSPAGLVDQLHPDTPGYPTAAAQQMSGDLADNIAGQRFFVRLMTAKPLPPEVEEAWLVQTLRMPVYARIAMRGRPLNNRDLLPTLMLPMAIVVGALDRSMPVDTLQPLSAAHPNMAYRSVPDAAHALAWENPAVFNPLLRDFVERAMVVRP